MVRRYADFIDGRSVYGEDLERFSTECSGPLLFIRPLSALAAKKLAATVKRRAL